MQVAEEQEGELFLQGRQVQVFQTGSHTAYRAAGRVLTGAAEGGEALLGGGERVQGEPGEVPVEEEEIRPLWVSPKPSYTRAYASSAPLALAASASRGRGRRPARGREGRTVMSTRSRLRPGAKRQLWPRLIVESREAEGGPSAYQLQVRVRARAGGPRGAGRPARARWS